MTEVEPSERFRALLGSWRDDVLEAMARDPALSPKAWDGNPAQSIVGVARTGLKLDPCLLVRDASAMATARAWAERHDDRPPRISLVGEITLGPSLETPRWGQANHFPNEAVGGKLMLRHKGDGLGASSWAMFFSGASNRATGIATLHGLVSKEGAAAPPREFDLLEADGTLFANVGGFRQLTTNPWRWPNTLDVGIGRIRGDWPGRIRPGEIGGLGRVTEIGRALPGEPVLKQGARTGLTRGIVTHVFASVRVPYGWGPGAGEFVISECTFVRGGDSRTGSPFGAGGDSGSPVVKRATGGLSWLGIYFAGSAERGVYCDAARAVETFGLRLPP